RAGGEPAGCKHEHGTHGRSHLARNGIKESLARLPNAGTAVVDPLLVFGKGADGSAWRTREFEDKKIARGVCGEDARSKRCAGSCAQASIESEPVHSPFCSPRPPRRRESIPQELELEIRPVPSAARRTPACPISAGDKQ